MARKLIEDLRVGLTVAGSDPTGGAGIQADLRTFAALEVHGLSVITALTAQSTTEIRGIHAVPPEFVRAQLLTLLDDVRVDVLKTGMLHCARTVRVVSEVIRSHALRAVVDPVMVSTSGTRLLEAQAISSLVKELLPIATLISPNLPEVEVLLGALPSTLLEMADAGRALVSMGAGAALIKGGHLPGSDRSSDVLVLAGGSVIELESERVDTSSTHGTGCTYSAAIAAYLARGFTLAEAVREAHAYVQRALRESPKEIVLGRGPGPLHHMHPHYSWGGHGPD